MSFPLWSSSINGWGQKSKTPPPHRTTIGLEKAKKRYKNMSKRPKRLNQNRDKKTDENDKKCGSKANYTFITVHKNTQNQLWILPDTFTYCTLSQVETPVKQQQQPTTSNSRPANNNNNQQQQTSQQQPTTNNNSNQQPTTAAAATLRGGLPLSKVVKRWMFVF